MATFRKDSSLRVVNPDSVMYGYRYISVGKQKSVKGERFEVVRRLGSNYESQFKATDLAAEAHLGADKIVELDKVMADKEERDRLMRIEFERKDIETKAANLKARRDEDDIWILSAAENLKITSRSDHYHSDGKVTIIGPSYERDGETYTRDLSVDASARKDHFSYPKEYILREVNWSAIGSVSPAIARCYAKAILAAADLAESLEVKDEEAATEKNVGTEVA